MTYRRNHKAAIKEPNATILLEKNEKEVHHSFMIPVIASAITKIENLSINQMGVADQWTISEDGKLTPKKRATHGYSFPNKNGNSLNN